MVSFGKDIIARDIIIWRMTTKAEKYHQQKRKMEASAVVTSRRHCY